MSAQKLSAKAYGEKRTAVVRGRSMAYVEQGAGPPIVFQHGNPTSSYLWRNVMPHLEGLGRLIACDLIGMGDSDKLDASGPGRYTYVEQREYLFALWEQRGIDRNVVLVLHDWGSALGFDWASQHRDQVAGIAYMEAIVTPLQWDDYIQPGVPRCTGSHALRERRARSAAHRPAPGILPDLAQPDRDNGAGGALRAGGQP
jgi:haloalkane dehalogenase